MDAGCHGKANPVWRQREDFILKSPFQRQLKYLNKQNENSE